jgi:hypothetical protein
VTTRLDHLTVQTVLSQSMLHPVTVQTVSSGMPEEQGRTVGPVLNLLIILHETHQVIQTVVFICGSVMLCAWYMS